MRIVAALAAVAVLFLAGCAGPEPPACSPAACDAASAPPSAPDPASAVALSPAAPAIAPIDLARNATIPRLEFENCNGFIGGFEIPADLATGRTPAAFAPSGRLPAMASLDLDLYACPRVVATDRVLNGASMLWTSMIVAPNNASWSSKGLSFWPFDVLVSDPELLAPLRAAGAEPALATFRREVTQTATRFLHVLEIVSNENVTFEVTYHYFPGSTGGHEFTRYHWFGGDPFRRMEIRHVAKFQDYEGMDAGTLKMSGRSGYLDAALGRPISLYDSQTLSGLRWSVSPEPKLFENPK